MGNRTMAMLSYGISTPEDLLEKLKRDGARLTSEPQPDDIFNFLVTAAALSEWVGKVFVGHPIVEGVVLALRQREWQVLPPKCASWLTDRSCIPNPDCDMRGHIFNALSICWETAGASKHYFWQGGVKAVEPEPIVGDFYQYFTTSVEPDLYIDYEGEVYGLLQVRGIVLEFYRNLLADVRNTEGFALDA